MVGGEEGGGRKEKGRHRIRQEREAHRKKQRGIQKTEVVISTSTKFFPKVTGAEKDKYGEPENPRIGEHRDVISGIWKSSNERTLGQVCEHMPSSLEIKAALSSQSHL